MPDDPVAPQPEVQRPQEGARKVRPVVETRGYDQIEVPPELEGLDPETGKPYIEEMYPGHLHTPLCGSRERIVVGVDCTLDSGAALRWAAEEARLRHTHLHLVHGYALLSEAEDALRRRDLGDILRALLSAKPNTDEQREEAAREHSDLEIRTTLDRTLPATLPVDIESLSVAAPAPEALVAASHGAALLVVGHHHDDKNSVAKRTAALATCPVTVVRAGCRLGLRQPSLAPGTMESPQPVYDRIVVGVDDSFTGRDALWFAANEAVFRTGRYGDEEPHAVEMLVVNVAPPAPSRGPGDPVAPAGPAWDLLEYLVAEVFSDRAVVREPDLVNITTDVQGALRRDPGIPAEPVVEQAVFRRPWPADVDDLEGEGRQGIEEVLGLEERLAVEERVGAVNLRAADSSETLIGLSDRADLLVVGVHGHSSGSGARFASVTSDCLRGAKCPVVVVPDTREDENAGIRRAALAFEKLWTRGRTPTSWPSPSEPVRLPAVPTETTGASSKTP